MKTNKKSSLGNNIESTNGRCAHFFSVVFFRSFLMKMKENEMKFLSETCFYFCFIGFCSNHPQKPKNNRFSNKYFICHCLDGHWDSLTKIVAVGDRQRWHFGHVIVVIFVMELNLLWLMRLYYIPTTFKSRWEYEVVCFGLTGLLFFYYMTWII